MAHRIASRRSKPHIKREICRVHSVHDGDTVTIEQVSHSWLGFKKEVRLVKVRLAYIDTPELRYRQAGAMRAKDLLEKLISGRHVLLEYEQLPNGRPRTGDYGRILAVVHLQRTFLPNVNINQLLLKRGLARLYNNPDNITPHHWKRLVRAERYAQRRHLGVWRTWKDQPDRTFFGILPYIVIGILIGILIGIALA